MEAKEKREFVKRVDGSDIQVDYLNRKIGERADQVDIKKLTISYPDAASVPEYIFDAAARLTLIRVQDDARRTMNKSEIAALDGTTINARDFWLERRKGGARKVKFDAEKAAAKMTSDDLARLMANPRIAEMLKQMQEMGE